ncbi:dipeptidase [Catenibacterium mitsuokai]|uniref:dipeptidase n=1 Tax=Catenibacterium mitsuokai TaxID=100886 RepID=UPI003F9121B3
MKVVDMHCDTLYEMEKNHLSLSENNLNIDLKKMEEGDYLLQNFAIFTELKKTADPVDHVMKCIDYFYQEMRKNKDKTQPVTTYDEIMENTHNGVMSALLTIEEGAVIHEDLSYLRNYYRLGVRMVALSWNHVNGLTYPNFDMNDDTYGYHTYDDVHGLTDAGKAYIKEMEDLGMIIDVSHMSDRCFYDVLDVVKKPFVASHSNARAVCPHARNMSDDMILKLAHRGGVMGLNYAAGFLGENAEKSRIEDMVKHILYIKDLAGIDCIGLGSDFDGISQNLEMKNASYLPRLEKALRDAGLTTEEIEKVFYKNVLRVYREVLK